MYLVNTDTGATAIRVNAVTYSGVPTWVTGSSLTEGAVDEAISIQLSANDATSYQLQAGSTLPTGLTLSANGLLSGTVTGLNEDTLYNFTIEAIDDENQDSPRAFSITITAGDQNINSVVLALKADSNTFITDASTNSFTITPAGDTRPSAFSPHNTNWSNYFDGTGDYLSVPNNAIFDFGTGSLTVEAWIYTGTKVDYQSIIGSFDSGSNAWYLHTNSSGTITYGINASNPYSGSRQVCDNAWHHIAMVRNGSSDLRLYVDGVLDGSQTDSTNVNTNNEVRIGSLNSGATRFFNGYISNVRVTNGAVYTEAFTLPTSPLTAISGTSLLTCHTNRFADGSTNNFTITKNGDVKVTAFGPFTETDTATGSGYFDGTGDYLNLSSNAALTPANGDFCVECWIYPTAAFDTYNGIFVGNATNGFFFGKITGGIGLRISGVSDVISATAPNINQWTHIAITRSGTDVRLFYNGVQQGSTVTNSTNFAQSATFIGDNGASSAIWEGYISNLRFVKGTAVYTSNFTPPTSPLTAISGTSLLTLQSRISYNNSQPIDESGVNNIITRNGNASAGSYSPLSPAGWSAYFDGTGDGIRSNLNDVNIRQSFTFECWAFLFNNTVTFWSGSNTAGSAGQTFYLNSVGGTLYLGDGTSNNITVSMTEIPLNQWNHIAVTYDGSYYRVFVNGVLKGNSNVLLSDYTLKGIDIGLRSAGATIPSTGYISNFRIVKGSAIYTSNFTPPTEPLEPIANTSLLTLRSNSFVDEGPNRFAITRNGDTRITPFSPFKTHTIVPDSHSVYFDGTGDYLSVSHDEDFNLAAGDFTIEGYFYFYNTGSAGTAFFAKWPSPPGRNFILLYLKASSVYRFGYSTDGSNETLVNSSAMDADINRWVHLAVVRNGESLKVYKDGQEIISRDIGNTVIYSNSSDFLIGRAPTNSGYDLNGYCSDFRFIKGTALYTSNFTPPTAPLTAIANTSLLTCQSPTVIDNSNNAFAITVNGNAQPSKYNPFGETITTGVEYSLTNHGGSYYFDGTGDYLNTPATGQFAPAGVFTIECFVYITSLAAARAIIGNYTTNATTDWVIDVTTAGVLRAFTNGSTARISSASGAIQIGEWEHVVLTRNSSNVISLFLNGALIGTYSQSGVFGSATKAIYIGVQNVSTNPMLGYISNLRVVEGTALYTSAFVPPTAPPTPVSGTTLLLNGAGSAITDGVSKNVLETVGNARIINGVKKYGTGAMYFDGTGDYLTASQRPSAEAQIGSGNWTCEFWAYAASYSAIQIFTGLEADSGTGAAAFSWVVYCNAGKFGIDTSTGSASNFGLLSVSNVPTNEWVHLSITRSVSTCRIFINGIIDATSSTFFNAPFVPSNSSIRVGGAPRGFPFNGYIDDLRITKGVARYTSNFTPPTSFKLK
jgi:hypothetical protein